MEPRTLTGNPDLVGDCGFDQPPDDPLESLKRWLDAAGKLGVSEPRGITLATVDSFGRPSTRVLFLRSIGEKGLVFSTSSGSAKGKDLAANPWAAGTLWWRETVQQINVQGFVRKLSDVESDEVFMTRTREAKAVSVISKQSAPLENEKLLKDSVNNLVKGEGEIVRPNCWHAYILEPTCIEFWHGGTDRFHKRLRYDLKDGNWGHQRLQP
ncbi:pyridoxal 5'-phosphate synthase [Candidatus Finniella inopinata]|uniref:Pyridoxamine 5'-phosphate oxidase n=1 Tax=Candidatus Finniella inopinata TaxID=1696036 RepID=A0A4V2DZS9_9PROT|nr:pyridoxal 5'-phosphate synthase [Candidatus Finniella inopinata]RZI46117.1 pyridoxamine 5'-phosphate oxidase [Candidatus Finniella inopinata]